MNKHSPTVPDIAVWPITSVLLLYGLIALGGLLNFPPFIDEGLHISYAQRVLFSGRVLAGASDSRLLVPLLLAPFAPVGAGQLFIGRVVTVLAGLISIALVYRLTRDLSNHAAARLAALFAVFCPYLLFYQRMVLIDSYTMMAGLLIVVLVYRSRDKRWREYGIACGVALAGAVAIKGTAIVFLAIPAIALLLDRRRGTRWLFVCYAVFGAIWIPLYLLLRSRGINYFGLAEAISGAQGAGAIFNRLLANIGAVWNIDAAYLSVPFLLVFILASVWWLIRAPRRAGLPILSLIIPTLGIIALSPLARARWLLPHVPLLIIAGMIGLEHLRQSLPAFWRRAIPALLLTGWIVGVFLPFYLPLRTNPALLPLS
jgi:4-amino-4-deoxy-L-arabinose transferase-like glycosyltransferase